jgi:hypothetical protein
VVQPATEGRDDPGGRFFVIRESPSGSGKGRTKQEVRGGPKYQGQAAGFGAHVVSPAGVSDE